MRVVIMSLVGLLAFLAPSIVFANDPVFSGPQVGEELATFKAQGVFGDNAGKKVDVIGDSKNAPTLLVFVHQVTRPSIGLTRLLINYASKKKKDGLKIGLVFLSDDPTETEAWMGRARRALPEGVTPLISPDGIEGPGAYGLNRKMTMTVLVGNKGKVTANFPLIQPSIQADATKIGHAITNALGQKEKPSLKDMGFQERRMRPSMNDGTYRRMMAPVIQKTATAKEVDVGTQRHLPPSLRRVPGSPERSLLEQGSISRGIVSSFSGLV